MPWAVSLPSQMTSDVYEDIKPEIKPVTTEDGTEMVGRAEPSPSRAYARPHPRLPSPSRTRTAPSTSPHPHPHHLHPRLNPPPACGSLRLRARSPRARASPSSGGGERSATQQRHRRRLVCATTALGAAAAVARGPSAPPHGAPHGPAVGPPRTGAGTGEARPLVLTPWPTPPLTTESPVSRGVRNWSRCARRRLLRADPVKASPCPAASDRHPSDSNSYVAAPAPAAAGGGREVRCRVGPVCHSERVEVMSSDGARGDANARHVPELARWPAKVVPLCSLGRVSGAESGSCAHS